MSEVFKIFAILLGAAMLAGYLPIRLLAPTCPRTSRLALQPLVGAGIIALTLGWVHSFSPLGDRLALAGLVPVGAGSVALAIDLIRGRVLRPSRPDLVWGLLCIPAAAIALAPFLILGSATSFGLYSNDAFWWTAADWRVQRYAFAVADEQVTSPMARVAIGVNRYGFNYLSVLVQALTGLRSWQVVHVTGAFGLFLLTQAVWILARRLRAWWWMALLIALAAATNHFIYRLFLDAVLAFQFGLSYVVAIVAVIAGPLPRASLMRRSVLAGILGGSLAVFYADLLPAAGVAAIAVCGGLLVLGTFSRPHLALGIGSAGAGAVCMLPMLPALPEHLRKIATAPPLGPFYRLNDTLHTWTHVLGASDVYHYMHQLPYRWIQFIGAAAASLLLLRVLTTYKEARRLVLSLSPVIVAFFLLWRYLMRNGQEYSAHRVMVFAVPFALLLMLGSIRPRSTGKRHAWLAVALVALVCNLYPMYRMLQYFRQNYIAVTATERQIGDDWIPALPADSKITIDVEEDLQLFYGHYMYVETLWGLRGNERRIVLPRTFYNFVQGTPVDKLDPLATEYVLRRKGRGRMLGDFRPIRTNDRYELVVPVDRASTALVWFGHGFYPLEGPPGREWRWLGHHGHVTVASGRAQTLKLTSNLEVNPILGDTRLDVTINGREIERIPIRNWKLLSLELPLQPGANTVSFYGLKPGAPIPAVDARPVGIRFWTPRAELPSRGAM